MPSPSLPLITELRRRIKDQSYVASALTIAVSDTATSAASLEITNGRLILVPTGGTVRPFDMDLYDPHFDTVGGLYDALKRFPGISVQIDRDADLSHSSLDIEPFGPTTCRLTGVSLRHHVFADVEIEKVLTSALLRHNPSYSPQTLPQTEQGLVLALAEANIYRMRAGDASKRKGMDASVSDLLALAVAIDGPQGTYELDARRLRNVIAKKPEAPSGDIGTGDLVLGRVWRRSPRNGFMSPMSVAEPIAPVILLDPEDGDAEDTNIRVHWDKSRDTHFHSYELWMDTQSEVLPQRESILLSGLPVPMPSDRTNQGEDRPSTSKLVFRAFGANSNYSTVAFSTFVESYGQNILRFNVPNLEPETDYFFRIRVTDLNFVGQLSQVVRIRTRKLRVRFDPTNPYTPTFGPAGTVVVLQFDPTKGAVNTGTKVLIGMKEVPLTITGAYSGTITVPTFVQTEQPKDLVVVDNQGLKDIKFQVFTVTT